MRWETGLILLTLFQATSAAAEPEPRRDQGKDELIFPKSRVKAAVGEDVTLDCHLEPRRDVTEERFEWKFNESHRVLIYRSRDFSAVDQAEQFRGRASFDSSGDLTEGKLPVKISSVNKTDAGRYSCSVGKGTERISCSTELIIDTKTETEDNIDREEVAQDPSPTRKNTKTETEDNRHYGLISTGIIAIILIASLICCGLKSTSAGQEERGNNRENMEDNPETMRLDNVENTDNTHGMSPGRHRRGRNRENEESSGSDQHEH